MSAARPDDRHADRSIDPGVESSPEQLRLLCVSIAREAGDFAHRSRIALGPGARISHETKSSEVDPVTVFDEQTEQLVVDRLRASRPDDAIVGEEGSNHHGTSGLTWHVDPIDGTVNFVYDLPMWCTSIAVLRAGQPVAGAIYAPVIGDLFSASLGGGAFVGDHPLHVSTSEQLATSLLATGFSYHVDEHRNAQAARIAQVLPRVRDIRRSGSAALDLATVASGRVDGYFEEFINSWDVAAGVLLVTEAGGVVTRFDGGPLDVTAPDGVVASNSTLLPHIAELIG